MKITAGGRGDDPVTEFVDDGGNVLTTVEYDDTLDDAIMKVAQAICKATGVEFDSGGWGRDFIPE